jgi:hypothetical protein
MMLTGRNELLAVGALVVYIAFVPCPYVMKQFFSSTVGKAVALGVFVYVFKYVSELVAILLLVNFLRSGGVREYLEAETGMTPSTTQIQDYRCPDQFMYDTAKKTCMKGTESQPPECLVAGMTWNSTEGKCAAMSVPSTPPASSGAGPVGGSTPGAMAAQNAMANTMPPIVPPVTEAFSPYAGGEKQKYAPA